jgi:hypothetical protein
MKIIVHTLILFHTCIVALTHTVSAGGLVTKTSVGYTPLTELGTGTYLGRQGGLYPGGSNDIPAAHFAAGEAQSAAIQPLDAQGNPSPDGKIGVITTGMSNANQIFERLGELLQGAWADKVVYVNAAQGGMDASIWADRNSTAWSVALGKVTSAGLTTKQIQVALNYHAVAHINNPPKPWPATPGDMQTFAETIAGHLASTFPALRLCYWGTREYGGYSTSANNPEPYAYQSGFALKWMIERQINGLALNYDASRGAVTAPWMAWGPYTWADGIHPRADGLYYEPRDFRADGTHPSMRGRAKVAWPWVQFLRTHPLTATKLFPLGNSAPVCSISFPQNAEEVMVGSKVAVEAFAGDEDSGIHRVDFYHGTTLIGSDDTAPFCILWLHPGPGDYAIHAIARDKQGAQKSSLPIIAKLRPITPPNDTIAEDSFESGDFRGGSGWSVEWAATGNPVVVTGQAEDGLYSARLDDGDSLARSRNLSTPAITRLRFAWRGSIPAGSSLIVEIRDTTWRPVFQSSATNQTSRTDTIQSSTILGNWSDLYHVTGDESSVILLPQESKDEKRFFRVVSGIP